MPSLDELGLNRFVTKGNESSVGRGAAGMAVDSSTTTGDNFFGSNNFDTKDARQIQPGTVISNCFIRTTDLPARLELSGNDILIYDDTTGGTTPITGDSALIKFIRTDNPDQLFSINKRAAQTDDLGNVMEFFYSAPPSGNHYNTILFGRDGPGNEVNTGNIFIAVNVRDGQPADVLNGNFGVEVWTNSVIPPTQAIFAGDSRLAGAPSGFSTFINADDGGLAGIAYGNAFGIFMLGTSAIVSLQAFFIPTLDITYDIGALTNRIRVIYTAAIATDEIGAPSGTITFGGHLIPNVDDVYDVGSPAFTVNNVWADNLIANGGVITGTFVNGVKSTFNGSVVACPLPTVDNALEIIRKIPKPTKVGDRGHYGDKLYFDDLTFPEEVLWEIDGVKEIEHTHMIGLLMKAVVELTKEVDYLKTQFNK